MDALTGILSTYPDGTEEQAEEHRELLKMEKAGTVKRHCDMEHSDQVPVRFVIWVPVVPVEAAPAPEPAPEPEPEPNP